MLLELINNPSIPYDTLVVELKIQEEQYPGFLSLWLKKDISEELEQTKRILESYKIRIKYYEDELF